MEQMRTFRVGNSIYPECFLIEVDRDDATIVYAIPGRTEQIMVKTLKAQATWKEYYQNVPHPRIYESHR